MTNEAKVFLDVGLRSFVVLDEVLIIVPASSAYARRCCKDATQRNQLIETTGSRKRCSLIITKPGPVVTSCLSTMSLRGRAEKKVIAEIPLSEIAQHPGGD